MTIFLSKSLPPFRRDFDEICNRILQSSQDEIFYTFLVKLMAEIRQHPLFKEKLARFEEEAFNLQKEFSKNFLEYHEYNWKKLWQYHRQSYTHRKQLARIKRIITRPMEISTASLNQRLSSAMWEFRCHSPFFRFIYIAPTFFFKACSDMRVREIFIVHSWPSKERGRIWRERCPLQKMNKKTNLFWKFMYSETPKGKKKFKWAAEPFSALFSPLASSIERKHSIPGQNTAEKKRNIMIQVETDFSVCWGRLRFLEQCLQAAKEDFKPPQRFVGNWEIIREIAWNTALERCEKEMIHFAKMSLYHQISSKTPNSLDIFLPSEWQICRSNYEAYLKSFKNHIHTELSMIENLKEMTPNNPLLVTEGTQRMNFAIDLAKQYWKFHPTAIYDDVFADYLCKCPRKKILSRSSWERIVRERKLDPRSPKTKKRGNAKKRL